uniref:ISXO2-like transposase domain-containing protein n=1 Tax=Octopus bimaculoides TaxID=37653 RepID=A0A0L8H278_OCTBM
MSSAIIIIIIIIIIFTTRSNCCYASEIVDVCSAKLLQDKTPISGPDQIVEIDESLLFNNKNNLGRMCRKTWVVGCYDTTTKKGFLQRVPDRSTETLENVIRQNVLPGRNTLTLKP